MIKAIIFDVGGVYMQGSSAEFIKRSARILGINSTPILKSDLVFDPALNKGTATHEDCFRNFFKLEINHEQMEMMKEVWMDTWKPSEEMLELVKELKKHYALAILSNSDSLNSDNYTRKGWYAPFDILVLSHELGIIKPDKRIYQITLERLGRNPEECLFIDDQKAALEPAKALGMDTIHFRSFEELIQELRTKNILIQ